MQANISEYVGLVSKPGNRKDIWHKKTLGCMAGLALALICVAAAGLLVVIQ